MSFELSPCPFCGGHAVHRAWADPHLDRYKEYFIECIECRSRSGHQVAHIDDAYGAIRDVSSSWNRRAVLDRDPKSNEVGE